jgi:hypothetical protein
LQQEAVGKPPGKPEPEMENKMDDTKRYERLRERYPERRYQPRNFLGLIGAAGAAYGVQTPFARQALAQSDVSQVRFDGWGGVVSRRSANTPSIPTRKRPA